MLNTEMEKVFGKFVDTSQWRFAKTYANKAPHEYIVKHELDELKQNAFIDVVMLIRQQGFPAFFGGYEHIYLYYEGHYYWTMGDPIEDTYILNRCKYDEYEMKYVGS